MHLIGSMYLFFIFQDPEGNKFSDFIYPIMGNKNRHLKDNRSMQEKYQTLNAEGLLHIVRFSFL